MTNNENSYAVGLDIGTTKIVAIVGTFDKFNKLNVMAYSSVKSRGVKNGVVFNIKQTIESIQEAITRLENETGIKIHNVTVGIAGQHIRSSSQQIYNIRQESSIMINEDDLDKLDSDIRRLKYNNGDEILHTIPQEYEVDEQSGILNPIGMSGSKLGCSYIVIIGNTQQIEEILRCVEGAGLKVEKVTLEPIASGEAVLTNEEKEEGVAIIDIGGGTTDLAIIKNNILKHTVIIPSGGQAITEKISSKFAISIANAELLKQKFGKALPLKSNINDVVQIAGIGSMPDKEISIRELSKLIFETQSNTLKKVVAQIDDYLAKSKIHIEGGIYITGGGSKLKGIKHLMSIMSDKVTKIGVPSEILSGETDTELMDPIFSTAIGLLMLGLNSKTVQETPNKNITFDKEKKAALNEEIIEEKEEKDKKNTIINYCENILKNIYKVMEDKKEY